VEGEKRGREKGVGEGEGRGRRRKMAREGRGKGCPGFVFEIYGHPIQRVTCHYLSICWRLLNINITHCTTVKTFIEI